MTGMNTCMRDWNIVLYDPTYLGLLPLSSSCSAHTQTQKQELLCTLSMMSNPHINEITLQVPVETVISDEASQIEVGDYLPLFQRFQPTLQKMVLIGDDKQRELLVVISSLTWILVAPFGQDDVEKLRSVFEFPHFRRRAHFLDTQYRMPFIGSFISRHVYNQKLMTVHDIKK
ncbi:hypothetical protein BDR07DRAFT_1605865 [Suillus spraguei]|nr:hypothetical protein BDR07DRAFT_1605865 [Suillus spraguei]